MAEVDLDAMVAALRERGDAAPRQVEVTRRRVLASLEQRATGGRRRVAVIVAALTLGTGTLSWAATTGRLAPVLATIGLGDGEPPALAPERGVLDRSRRPHGSRVATAPAREAAPIVAVDEPVPAPEPVLAAQPTTPEPPMPSPPPPSRRRARAAEVVVDLGTEQFRRANQLHVRGGDPAAALAAWDDYLAAYPGGSLALEARYNRALALVRLRRWDDALAALAPFVAGDVQPAGYRQADATALAAAIERRVEAARTRGAP